MSITLTLQSPSIATSSIYVSWKYTYTNVSKKISSIRIEIQPSATSPNYNANTWTTANANIYLSSSLARVVFPGAGYYNLRAVATLADGSTLTSNTFSNVVMAYKPSRVTSLTGNVVGANIVLNWLQSSLAYTGYLPTPKYEIAFSLDASVWTVIGSNGFAINNGPTNTYSFPLSSVGSNLGGKVVHVKISVQDTHGYRDSSPTYVTVDIPSTSGSGSGGLTKNKLFNKDSFRDKGLSNLLIQYLDAAADRWDTYIKYQDWLYNAVINSPDISGPNGVVPGWKGCALRECKLVNAPTATWAAACGPGAYVDWSQEAGDPGAGTYNDNRINILNFVLYVNTAYFPTTFTSKWVDVIAHELGHGLGIGVLHELSQQFNSPIKWYDPVTHLLNGAAYPETQKAYNKLGTAQGTAFVTGRKYIPINHQGGGEHGHFAHERNTFNKLTSFHPPVKDDIMSYYNFYGQKKIISPLSLGYLIDSGYELVSAGSAETMTTAPALSLENIELLGEFGCGSAAININTFSNHAARFIIDDVFNIKSINVYKDILEGDIDSVIIPD